MKVVLRAKDIGETEVRLLNVCKERICLVLMGAHDLHELKNLQGIKRLKDLVIRSFRDSTFPDLRNVFPHLETLSLEVGRLLASEGDRDPFSEKLEALPDSPRLPANLKSLTLSCGMDHAVADNFLTNGQHLIELRLKMHCISDKLKIDRCTSLRVLELVATKEFIGEILEKVKSMRNLEILRFQGCLNLTADHLNSLTSLRNLKELFIGSSVLDAHACEEIASIASLNSLTLHSCLGVKLFPFCENPRLRTVRVINCNLWGRNVSKR